MNKIVVNALKYLFLSMLVFSLSVFVNIRINSMRLSGELLNVYAGFLLRDVANLNMLKDELGPESKGTLERNIVALVDYVSHILESSNLSLDSLVCESLYFAYGSLPDLKSNTEVRKKWKLYDYDADLLSFRYSVECPEKLKNAGLG